MAAYMIKSWRASDDKDVHNNYITIIGRKEGIISWVLALFRIDPTVSITVSDARIEFSEGSLSGSVRRLIPLTGVCSSMYGYHKPWQKAVTIFLFLAGIAFGICNGISSAAGNNHISFGAVIISFVFGSVIAILYYFLNRTLTLGFIENSGAVSAIQFKRSVIEGQDINEAQAGYVCQLVQFFVEARQRALMEI